MNHGIDAAASGMNALSRQYEIITNNLANVSTAGFKRKMNSFSQVLQQRLASTDGQVPLQPAQIRNVSEIDFQQGQLKLTGRKLDVGLQGPGFMVLETPGGVEYTRCGIMHLSAQGQLTTGDGKLIAGQGGPIVIPPDVDVSEVTIGRDGTVNARGRQLGTLQIVEIDDTSQLRPTGNNAFRLTDQGMATPAQATTVHQGFQEGSNVNSVEEMIGLITVSRMYEANARSIQVQDQRMKQLLQVAAG